jgi:HEAT repeat protein
VVVPVLVAALHDRRAKIRQAAADALWVLGPDAQAAVPALATLLSDKDPYVRWAALEALDRVGRGAEAAVPALLEVLKDGDLCGSAGQALGHIGPGARAAVPALLQEFKAGHSDAQRMSVALALARIDPQAARVTVPFLIERVQKNDDRISLEAIQALMAMGAAAQDAVPALTEMVGANRVALSSWSACALVQIAGPQANSAIPQVLNLLGYDEIFGASDLLAQLGPPAVPTLLDAVRHGASRHRAGRVLGLIGSKFPEVIPTLASALKDKDAGPRQAASEAFWVIGAHGREAVPELTRALQDEDVMVRHGAAWALVHILGSEATAAVPPLIALAGEADNDPHVRRSAILGLGAVGRAATEGVPLLTALEEDSFFHVAALRSRLLVTGVKPERMVRVLVQALKEKGPWARREAAAFLAELGPVAQNALPALTEALNDEDEEVCHVVADALRRVGPARRPEDLGPFIVCVLIAALFFGLAGRARAQGRRINP